MSPIVARAQAHASDVLRAHTTRGVLAMAYNFKVFLAHVPDQGPIGKDELQEIFRIAEGVIEHIEARIDARGGSQESKVELANMVYRVRARLEEIARWGQHLPS